MATAVKDANVMDVKDIGEKRYPMPGPDGKPIVDISFEEKMELAANAAAARAGSYEESLRYRVREGLAQRNLNESIEYIRDLDPGDRKVALQVERDNKDRAGIFKEFGQPEEE